MTFIFNLLFKASVILFTAWPHLVSLCSPGMCDEYFSLYLCFQDSSHFSVTTPQFFIVQPDPDQTWWNS